MHQYVYTWFSYQIASNEKEILRPNTKITGFIAGLRYTLATELSDYNISVIITAFETKVQLIRVVMLPLNILKSHYLKNSLHQHSTS